MIVRLIFPEYSKDVRMAMPPRVGEEVADRMGACHRVARVVWLPDFHVSSGYISVNVYLERA